jgi:hypothetical protein
MNVADEYQVDAVIPTADLALRSVATVATTAGQTVSSLERIAAAVEKTPEVITKEGAAALQTIHAEVSRSIEFVQQEPAAIFDQITKERIAALLDLHRDIAEERVAFTRDLQRLSMDVVDRAFLRAAQLAAILVLVTLGSAVVLLLLTRRLFVTKRASI